MMISKKRAPIPFGKAAQRFFLEKPPRWQNEAFIPPLSLEKVQTIAECFIELDADLENENQFIAYRQQVIRHCMGLEVKARAVACKGEVEKVNLYSSCIAQQFFLQHVNTSLEGTSSSEAYQQLLEEMSTQLKEAAHTALQETDVRLKAGALEEAMSFIRKEEKVLQCSIPSLILGEAVAQPILQIFLEKKALYEEAKLLIDTLVNKVCKAARPEAVIEDVIRQEIYKLKQSGFFKKVPEIGMVALSKYINSPGMIKHIHDSVIATRAEACQTYLLDSTEYYAKLSTELRKMTVYRVRRDVIARLFYQVLEEKVLFLPLLGARISKENEACLVVLQEEYLQALLRQVEKMDPVKGAAFIEKFKADPLLAPLPKTGLLSAKNDFASKELLLLIQNIDLQEPEPLTEEAPLHDIDSPIEMDILGELMRQLSSLFVSESTLEETNIILERLKNSYHMIQAPDFKPQLSLREKLLDTTQHEVLKQQLQNEKNQFKRIQLIDELYHFFVIQTQHRHELKKDRRLQQQIRLLLVELYVESLRAEASEVQAHPEYAYPFLQLWLLPALQSELNNEKAFYTQCRLLLTTFVSLFWDVDKQQGEENHADSADKKDLIK